MYGGILTIDYQQKDNHLLLTLPGRYQVKQLDDHQVAVKVINYSGCEDPDFSFYFVLHFEQPLTKWFAPSSGEDGKILLLLEILLNKLFILVVHLFLKNKRS